VGGDRIVGSVGNSTRPAICCRPASQGRACFGRVQLLSALTLWKRWVEYSDNGMSGRWVMDLQEIFLDCYFAIGLAQVGFFSTVLSPPHTHHTLTTHIHIRTPHGVDRTFGCGPYFFERGPYFAIEAGWSAESGGRGVAGTLFGRRMHGGRSVARLETATVQHPSPPHTHPHLGSGGGPPLVKLKGAGWCAGRRCSSVQRYCVTR